jgi:hypothetical protein
MSHPTAGRLGSFARFDLANPALELGLTGVDARRGNARYLPAPELDLDWPEARLHHEELHRAADLEDLVLDDDLPTIASYLERLVLRVVTLERHQPHAGVVRVHDVLHPDHAADCQRKPRSRIRTVASDQRKGTATPLFTARVPARQLDADPVPGNDAPSVSGALLQHTQLPAGDRGHSRAVAVFRLHTGGGRQQQKRRDPAVRCQGRSARLGRSSDDAASWPQRWRHASFRLESRARGHGVAALGCQRPSPCAS